MGNYAGLFKKIIEIYENKNNTYHCLDVCVDAINLLSDVVDSVIGFFVFEDKIKINLKLFYSF